MNGTETRAYYYAHSDDSAPRWGQLTNEQQREWWLKFEQTSPQRLPEIGEDGTGFKVSDHVRLGADDLMVIQDEPDLVNNPPHYTNGPKCPGCGRTIECIDITRWLPFNPGNAIKYLWRRYFGGKAGENGIEPVRKARWYVNDEVERLELEGSS